MGSLLLTPPTPHPPPPKTAWKMKVWKKNESSKKKKTPGDIILHKCTKNHDHMLYCTWDMVRDIKLFFILGYFLSFYTPNNLKNQNFKKKVKKRLEISSFYTCVPKMMIRWCMGPEIWYAKDGQMDGKSDIEVGAPPKKINISNRVQLSLG